ncbi:flagellar basal body L-ring protein FlgH [Croceicoccus sp. YJ47]|uniref:flagellar basal body L-ring protein FlgH n=1 Tax=Croceicoccus sp. YJ47 TaxID=2798724 RepID=UPI001924E12B|nr:flagellar basal body L-ring protein FlgH [Croceicoccus sp. YJ47]QQN75556.1 flagellar basal body L-ring protein FlgH [Croceicoccus sp. YJ47]
MRTLAPLSLGIVALTLSACATTQPQPGYQAALPAPPPVYAPRDGAIFHVADGYAGLHSGTRAARVGDPVTVLLVEFIDATKNADARTQRNGSASITPPASGPLDFLNPEALKAAAQSSFNGRGDAAQGSALSGAIAVTIAEVRPNGTALIKGERQMLLSQGTEWVQFSGIIRLVDIDYNNQIPSTAVADARIIYAGDGAVQQASRPGWLSRFFGLISPF